MKTSILIFLGIIAILTAQAQKCGSSINMQLIQKENTTLYNQLLKIEYHTNDYIKNLQLKSAITTNIIRIPVVVHVVYNTSDQNISDDQVLSQIEVLNEDYRRQNADKSNTPSEFSSVASDPQIEFFLACIDPNGNITNGITRTQTTQTKFTWAHNSDGTTNETSTRIKFTSMGGRDAWPSNRYLNIWTCNLTGNLLGYAQFPGIGQANTDGVVIMYNCFGKRGILNSTYNKGRTATHEIGHWLNLIHIWGDDDNNNGTCVSSECNGTDNVTDTPNQGESNVGCPTFPKTDCCTPISPGVMFMNYMDYTDDVCMNLFTSGQTNRMRALFATGGFRECFITNPVINNWCQSIINISGSSTVCSSGATFTLNNLPDGASVSWDKSFNLAYVSGQGTTSYKVKSSGGILPTVAMASSEDLSMMAPMAIESTGSSGWVRATISNSCGDIPLEKTVWTGLPGFIPVVSGYPTVTCGNSLFTEANNRTVTWSVGGPLQIVGSNYGYKCVVRGTGSGVGWVYATAANDCGSFRGELLVETSCGYSLAFSPNPSSGETTIEIATGSGEVLSPDTEWDLEVYDSMQNLKTKNQKLKGDKKAINTTGWKDGVYIVRVKIGNEIISEKLVVKH